jgi:hypothetical protein
LLLAAAGRRIVKSLPRCRARSILLAAGSGVLGLLAAEPDAQGWRSKWVGGWYVWLLMGVSSECGAWVELLMWLGWVGLLMWLGSVGLLMGRCGAAWWAGWLAGWVCV